jgi:hypothetical protein
MSRKRSIATSFSLLTLLLGCGLSLPTQAATFAVEDLSGSPYPCTYLKTLDGRYFSPADGNISATPPTASCGTYPKGALSLRITPQEGEFPLRCIGTSCYYAARVYVAAHYGNHWYAQENRSSWVPVTLDQLQGNEWTLFDGKASYTRTVYVGAFNPSTGQFDEPAPGVEVFAVIAPLTAPLNTTNLRPEQMQRIYPRP